VKNEDRCNFAASLVFNDYSFMAIAWHLSSHDNNYTRIVKLDEIATERDRLQRIDSGM
jgi:hypothetical protein